MDADRLPEVFVLNDYSVPNGGSSVVALRSAWELARRGVQVTLFTAKGPKPEPPPGGRSICLGQEEIQSDPNRLRAIVSGWFNIKAARVLRQALAGRDPRRTIIHVHTYAKALSPSVISTALDLGFPVILSLHDFFMACPAGTLFQFPKSEICELKPLSWPCVTCQCDRRHVLHKQWRVARTFLQNRILHLDRRITRYIGVSDFSVRVIKPLLPSTAKIVTIRNPVSCPDLGPPPSVEPRPFVFVGRFVREKGPLLFAEAVARLGVPAVFIGDGDLRDDLQRLCPGAAFPGWLPEEEVHRWLRQARALVFPPLLYETLGLVVVEAAALGVPSIVASRSAATDFVRHGTTGLVFEHGSVHSLCERIQELHLDAAKAADLGRNAYLSYWKDPWTLERHVDELLGLYRNLRTNHQNRG